MTSAARGDLAEDRVNAIAVALRVFETFHDQSHGTIAGDRTGRMQRRRTCCRAMTARASPAKSTAPTIAASSSPARSQPAAMARA